MWSTESSWRNCFPDREFLYKILPYLWNGNVVGSLTAFEISTITSNAIKLAFSLLWAQFTWGHWSKASSYLCLYIACSGDEGRNHASLVMCLILCGMKNTTRTAQTWCLAAFMLMLYNLSCAHQHPKGHKFWFRFKSRALHLCKVGQSELQERQCCQMPSCYFP